MKAHAGTGSSSGNSPATREHVMSCHVCAFSSHSVWKELRVQGRLEKPSEGWAVRALPQLGTCTFSQGQRETIGVDLIRYELYKKMNTAVV